MFKIRLADICIGIDSKYHFVRSFCKKYRTFLKKPEFYISVTEEEIDEEDARTEKSTRGYSESICIYRKIANEIINYDAFLLHSAAIEMEGKAFLFCGNSGVGKTTHICLWANAFKNKVNIINGDKPILRFYDDILYACGTPWCGKEGFQRNTKKPIKAICFLEQAPENSIRKLEKKEVISMIFQQILIPDDSEKAERLFGLIEKTINSIDCYLLKCNISLDAARLAYQEMSK